MKSIFFIARKYILIHQNAQAINLLSIITMLAMACGAAALVIILSTFNGFESLSRNLNESFQADLTILPQKNKTFDVSEEQMKQLSQIPNLDYISQTLEEKVYLKYLGRETLATLKGVDKSYFMTNEVKNYILEGDTTLETDEQAYMMIGAGIANKLSINPEMELEPVTIYFPKSESFGSLNLKDNFELGYLMVNGIFSIYQEYDENYALCPIDYVRFLKNSNESTVTSLEAKINKQSESQVRRDIAKILGSQVVIKNKLELDASFYNISRIEKIIVFLILTFVLIILSFNFIGSLTMHTLEKTKDIRTLHGMGYTQKNIFQLYMTIGISQGMLGGLMGVLFGLLICMIQKWFGIIKLPGSGTFVIDSYPVVIEFSDILMVILILLVISTLASIGPALRAKKILE